MVMWQVGWLEDGCRDGRAMFTGSEAPKACIKAKLEEVQVPCDDGLYV